MTRLRRKSITSLSPDNDIFKVEDLRQRLRQHYPQRLTIFVVDASESMEEETALRIAAAKGAILVLLRDAYVSRDRVALIAFRGEGAEVVVPPTRSIGLARERLQSLAVGGATPLAAGLRKALQLVRREQLKQTDLKPLLVLLSDGASNVPLRPGCDIWWEITSLADELRGAGCNGVVIAASHEPEGRNNLQTLAKTMGGRYYHLETLRTRQVIDILRDLDTE